MANPGDLDDRSLLEACAFAARAHLGQFRKDGKTPYFSHVFRVCLIVRDMFGVQDRGALVTALLHDAVEDTTQDYDDIEERFGPDVAAWVAALSKDKRLPEKAREEAYGRQLEMAPWQVKVCKLADIYDNLMDSVHTRTEQQSKTFKNAHRYLNAVKHNLSEPARLPWDTVALLLATMEAGK